MTTTAATTVDVVRLVAEMAPDEWDLGDAQDLVEISGVGFDTALDIVSSGDYRRISPGLLVALLTIEGRRSGGYTEDDIRAVKLVDALSALAQAHAVNNTE